MKGKELERIGKSISDWNENLEQYHTSMYKIITDEPIGEVRENVLESVKIYEKERTKNSDSFFNTIANNAYEAGKMRGIWYGMFSVVGGMLTGTLIGAGVAKIVNRIEKHKKE